MLRATSPRSVAIGAAALALAGSAGAAAAVTGGRYEGRSTQHGLVRLKVNEHGRRIVAYRLTGRFRCKGLPGHLTWRIGPLRGVRQAPIRIRSDGRFRATIHVRHQVRMADSTIRLVRGAYTVRGRFQSRETPPAAVASGRLRAVATDRRGLRCDSRAQRWSARLAR